MEVADRPPRHPTTPPNVGLQHIPGLPDDVVAQILRYLPLGDLATFCRVSKGCDHIGSSDAVWGVLAERDFPGAISNGYAQKVRYETYCKTIDSARLLEAASDQRFDRMRELLSKGVCPVVVDPRTRLTPLHYAALWGRVDDIHALLDAGATVEAKDAEGKTPLHYAALLNQSAEIHALLDAGAIVETRDVEGKTPLHHAARLGQVEAIAALLNRSADPEAKDGEGNTPLDCAVGWAKKADAVGLFQGACVVTEAQGWTPLHSAVTREKDHSTAISILDKASGATEA